MRPLILPLIRRDESDAVELYRRNPKLCVPSDFDYSPYFEIIKYPFFDFSDHSSYRLLPWSQASPIDAARADEEPPGKTESGDGGN